MYIPAASVSSEDVVAGGDSGMYARPATHPPLTFTSTRPVWIG